MTARLLRLWRASRLLRYTLAGGISALVDMAVFQSVRLWLHPAAADAAAAAAQPEYIIPKVCAFAAGLTVNFLLCLWFVFEIRGRTLPTALFRKSLSGAAALGVNLAALFVLVEKLGFKSIPQLPLLNFDGIFLANALAIGIAFLLNFVLSKYYAFGDY